MLLSKTLRSSTLKLALIYVALFCAAIFAVLGYVYWITAGYLVQDVENSLRAEQSLSIDIYLKAGRDGLATQVAERVHDVHFQGWVYLLVDVSGHELAGNLPAWPIEANSVQGSSDFWLPNDGPGSRQASSMRAEYTILADGSRLMVGRSVPALDIVREHITTALIAAAVLFLGLAAAAGVSTSRRSVARIEAINATSRQIMRSGLGERIPLRGTRDEWDGLATNLNSMLDRIQELAEWNRQVSDNVAHDLRTPMTRLRGRLEKAYAREPDLDGYRALVSDALAELDAILSTFSSLLRISRIEMRERMASFKRLDLTEVTREVVELFDPTAEAQSTRLQFRENGPAYIMGDRDLLFDAISNLIDNAIKHGGSDVSVAVHAQGEELVVTVADRGPGIPVEERQHVTRRFYRLEHSRKTPGVGLGLSLVAAVANLHSARIAMSDSAPGFTIELRFTDPSDADDASAGSREPAPTVGRLPAS